MMKFNFPKIFLNSIKFNIYDAYATSKLKSLKNHVLNLGIVLDD